MEWREPSADCDAARLEAQRWLEAVTKKKFGNSNFRSSLENGVLLCDLVNKIKPGIIKRVNRLSTPIAGLDNVNIFLKACARLGLKEAQLFHPGDLQDLSTRVTVKHQEASRRIKNVLITIYWLGRKAQVDPLYNGPYLNLKAFEGLLDTRLYKALEDCTSPRDSVRECEFGDSWYLERKAIFPLQAGHRREDSLGSLDSLSSRTTSTSSDTTLKGSSEGCGSDPEAEVGFRMSVDKGSVSYRRSLTVTPKTTTQFNQFLPSKDKQSGYVPAPLRKRRAERHDDSRRSWASPMFTEEDGTFSSVDRTGTGPSTASEANTQSSVPTTRVAWAYEYESSDSDADRPDPDLVLDDLASRRFHSPSPVTPTNFALPMTSVESPAMSRASWPQVTVTNVPQQTLTYLSSESGSPQKAARRPVSADVYMHEDSEDEDDEDDEIGYADPIQDDLYARKVGLMAQPSATMPYDKFLPKYWTPEEDVHVQKIKLGSQRRPWYRKIQGFSRKKSGSSPDDSDSDVNPWLCARSPFRSHSEPPPSYPHTPEASAQPCLPTSPSPPMQLLTAAQQSTGPPRLELPDFWPRPDPTSGPSLFKCERHPLRGRENSKDPYNVSEDILPDLENDDMFTRRTCAFHSSTELAWLKYGDFLTSHRRSEPYIRVVVQPRSGQPTYPDIERDDVLYRRVLFQSAQRPPSGAPDNYHPVPLPEPWTLPPKLQAKLLCAPCPPPPEQPKPVDIRSEEDHLKADDMLVRKLRMVHIQGMRSQSTPSVPSSCSEEDLQKWRAIREASRLRYKKRLMVERLLQKGSDSDGSKSMSDIAVEQAVTKQIQYEQLQKIRDQMRDSEDKWQDDLTKWKNRRKSVNSDIMKKKEEREQIESLTSSSSTRKSKTFKEMAEERENRGPGSYRSRFSTSDDQDVFEEPAPRSKTLPSRSYTIDNPYAFRDKPMVPSLSSLSDDEPVAGSMASDEAVSPQSPLNTSPGNQSKMSSSKENQTSIYSSRNLLDDPIPANITSKPSLVEPTSSSRSSSASSPPLEPNSKFSSTTKPVDNSSYSSSIRPVPEPRRPYGRVEEDQSQASLYKLDSVQRKQPEVAQVSASLPRSYRRSDSARLTSVVTPRPFGTQSNRVASMPRAYTMDDSHKRFNGDAERSEKTTVPSRYAPFMKEDEAHSQTSSAHSSDEEEEEEVEEVEEQVAPSTHTLSSVTPVSRVSPQPKAVSPVNNAQQESYSDMRISLNQKPGTSRDFGFQSTWDSTGAHVKSIQPGSPAQLSHLQVGDEILTVNGHKVADMGYEQWKSSMDQALQQGSLLMDIRRHGKNNWGRDLPSLPFKSHKTINLTSADPLGSPETYLSSNVSFTSHPAVDTAVKTLNVTSQNANNLASSSINGGIREQPVTLRNKGSAGNTVNALVYLCGGSETAISDLPVPSLSASSNRWSWDPEEERRRQEKWQKEQERLLQEKYRRDQEKLEEEFRKAQQEALNEGTKLYEEEMRSLELERLSINTYSPPSPLSQATPSSEEHEAFKLALQEEEERRQREENQRQEEQMRRKEEQERLEEEKRRRAEQEHLEEEKRRRAEQERLEEEKRRRAEKQRLEEERRRREEQERLEEERRRREQQKRLEEEKKKREEQERQRKEEERRRREEEERRRQEAQERQQENDVDYGKTTIFPELSYSDRLKSKSTPELDEMGKADTKGVYKKHRGLADWFLEEELRRKKDPHILRQQAASELELERRSILNAMKYRNPERAISTGLGEKKESLSQAELERQQIIQEMKKKTPLLTDSSWIRQQNTTSNTSKEPISLPMRRGESLDNLDSTLPSWRSSWTPGSTSSIPDYSRPYSSSSSHHPASATLPASQSLSSLRQSWSTSSTPAQVHNRQTDPQSRNRSVSGKKICTFCEMPLGKGAAMIIESLGLCYHLPCFKCIECKADLGGSEAGAEVRIRNKQLYCNSCYTRVKNGQPNDM
ncbi:LIM domain only protein 7 [Pygocentrus nattereri]|uniref:LIM domain only protein 7 n=1 Tax=Pygocentrus nattereri TaxID=42514 RepID=UPI001891489C|nr:LIM domain only protein 7 [Pygocentrus nattereri]